MPIDVNFNFNLINYVNKNLMDNLNIVKHVVIKL